MFLRYIETFKLACVTVYSKVYIIIWELTETMEETTMKRNLLIAIAVTAFMLATTIAQAADFEFSGKFRPRFEIQDDGNDDNSQELCGIRVRD